jgi:sialic acid synthase SpsE
MMNINGRLIGGQEPTYFIADIAANHDGDLNRAKDLISLCKEAGADAAKFQHFQASKIASDYGFKNLGKQMSHQAKWKKSVFDTYQDASLDRDWTAALADHCKKEKIDFFSSPYDRESIDHLDRFVPAYKIGSGDITWLEILKYMALKDKPVILATGASDIQEVIAAVDAVLSVNKQLALLQCNTNYTGSVENFHFISLNVLKTYSVLFPGIILGLSDHTPGHSTVLGAIALGARIIEKHFTDDNNREGPDHPFSMNPVTWKEMVERSRELEAALGSTIKKVEDNEKDTVVLQRRCLRASRDLKAGAVIKGTDVEVLRPAPLDAFKPTDLDRIVGKVLRRDIPLGKHFTAGDLE